MKILFLTTHLNAGGIVIYIYNLAKGLIQKGHKVMVISAGGTMQEFLIRIGVRVINLNIRTKSVLSPFLWLNLNRIVKIIQEEKIDVIHAHTRVTQVLAQVISNRYKIPYVSTCHGFFRAHWLRKKYGCWGNKVIAISEPVKEHLIGDLKVPPEKIGMVHNGIDLSRFSPVTQEQKKQSKLRLGLDDKITIGIIARLSVVKGHEYLIQAFKNILKQGWDCQLLIVGEGDLKKKLSALAARLEISNKVYFKPTIFNISNTEALSAIDVFCMPSLKEGLGLAVAEAQAAWIPVVASRVGGLVSLVKDGETGLLVPTQDPLALSNAIIRLLKDKELAESLTKNARKFIENNFSLELMADKIEKIYFGVKN